MRREEGRNVPLSPSVTQRGEKLMKEKKKGKERGFSRVGPLEEEERCVAHNIIIICGISSLPSHVRD